MRRWGSFVVLAAVLLSSGCTPLQQQEPPEDLVSLAQLPAEYGRLVTITHYGKPDDRPGWYELWFQDDASGRITLVPVHRATWSYRPDRVRVIDRRTAHEPG